MIRDGSTRHPTNWTAIAALVLALASGAYAVYSAIRGPKVVGFPLENVIIFGMPGDASLAAIAVPEMANLAATYPDIVVSQSIDVSVGETRLTCLSSRGGARVHAGESAPGIADEAETISLTGMLVEVTDLSARAELPAGRLFTARQLFDQLATTSEVDPCHSPGADRTRHTVAQLVGAHANDRVTLRYEAELARDDGVFMECSFDLNERRVERLEVRGWISVPCSEARTGKLRARSLTERLGEAFERLF